MLATHLSRLRPVWRRGPAAAVAIGTVAGIAACTSSGPSSGGSANASATGPAAATTLQNAYVSVVRKLLPSVVQIKTSSGLGSGVVYDSSGDIVTNAHVVGKSTSFHVYQSESASPVPATLVGSYPPDDIAVIKASDAGKLRPATFGDSDKLEVGNIVLAIGSPLGLASSATEGIVSAVGRTVSEPAAEGEPGATLPDTVQTSAAINPGNSGGALVDLAGQVIGVPTLAATQQSGSAAPGIGFAVSSNTAIRIAKQLISTGRVTSTGRASLGVQVATVAKPDGTPAGVGIQSVTSGGPAAQAGLTQGDLITEINGTATTDTQTLAAVLAGLRPGQDARVTVTRPDGSTKSVQVKLTELPAG